MQTEKCTKISHKACAGRWKNSKQQQRVENRVAYWIMSATVVSSACRSSLKSMVMLKDYKGVRPTEIKSADAKQ